MLVGVAQARDVEFDAVYAGDWMLHCHLPHHMMNQMVSMVGPAADAHHLHAAPVAPNAREVKGYPQDMWQVMDAPFADKPECDGLRPGWSAAMMGMMTLIRVLEPAHYDRIMARKAAAAGARGAA